MGAVVDYSGRSWLRKAEIVLGFSSRGASAEKKLAKPLLVLFHVSLVVRVAEFHTFLVELVTVWVVFLKPPTKSGIFMPAGSGVWTPTGRVLVVDLNGPHDQPVLSALLGEDTTLRTMVERISEEANFLIMASPKNS
jgi:hypothetical protein